MKPAQMLTIGGVYLVRGEPHVLKAASMDGIPCVLKNLRTGRDRLAGITEIEGPTHVPCPYCGKIQMLKSTHGQIELPEHLERCGFVRG